MFRINKTENSIEPLKCQTFADLGFRERQHLQEWIAKEPSCLGEELLIIQKEFAGFSDTNERLDLLAIDKQGALVLIENKLDDTGRDVTWQALKYASYCSSLSKENIRSIFQEYLDRKGPGEDAKKVLVEFLDADDYEEIALNKGLTQRIILIAANFRKEVTSTILWLLNFRMRIQCFRVTPWRSGDEVFLDVDQIIPTKDAEAYMIGLAAKSLDEVEAAAEEKNRNRERRKFWAELLELAGPKITRYANISPSTTSDLVAGSGVRGVPFKFVASRSYGRVELYIDRGDKEENKEIFNELQSQRSSIEAIFKGPLTWERLDDRRASRIKTELAGDPFDDAQRQALMSFMIDAMVRFENALKEPLARIQVRLRAKSADEELSQ
ncbi:hypothetical protein BDS110ZK18_42910 [Bradyrhizobium diazoefficiens]|uniref:DUF4268 domain-containing protein n=1 Tax=Bradyrhizobium diazoefficiens TaxID=1355477 RepID=A0A809XUM9_9BRAD|nr:hypothetical protein XF2B_49730 [Bradyrhizobium diazoefficiens]BCF18275.1 hypothetical protein XF13B_49660 [Bradyrhizobium diazoefficiens]